MVAAWYMSEIKDDQRFENQQCPPKAVSMDQLYRLTGVEYYNIDPEGYEVNPELEKIKKLKNITYDDVMTCSKECMENYEEKLKIFFAEHLHKDEEIRYVVDGSGYFDVRDADDQWIRIKVERGDLLILPTGIYHRFTLDMNNFIKAKRYFAGEPVWTPHNRPADQMDCRKEYVEKLKQIFST